jgi:hypothetical protein
MTGEVEVELLTPGKVEIYWPKIERDLLSIPEVWDKWWTVDALREGAFHSRFQVWTVGRNKVSGVFFSQFCTYPAGVILQVVLAFGKGLDECLPKAITTLQWYAKTTGCSRVEVHGRLGWEKKLLPYGFVRESVILSSAVPPGGLQ